MMRADERLRVFEVRGLAAGAGREIEQRKIDRAVAHIDRRADLEVFAPDTLEFENGLVEFRGLIEVLNADGEMAQTGHDLAPLARMGTAVIIMTCRLE